MRAMDITALVLLALARSVRVSVLFRGGGGGCVKMDASERVLMLEEAREWRRLEAALACAALCICRA